MKLVLCACLIFLCSSVYATEKGKVRQWYGKSNRTGECVPVMSPAEAIEAHKEMGNRYRVIDESTKNGKPIIVCVDNLENEVRIRFFRNKAICESYVAAKKKKDAAELDRYK